MNRNKLVMPILKWVGGKRQLLPEIRKELPNKYATYYEPFLGGVAGLFGTQPKAAVVNDFNSELINVYEVVRDSHEELIRDLKKHKNTSEYFYKIRELDRKKGFKEISKVKRASRVIYLNKTCYNGLYRVNNAGEFNAPFGRYKNPNIVNESVVKAVSKYLKSANIKFLYGDFEKSLKNIKKGAFVYFDPPYDPVSKSSNFTGYVEGGFGREEQIRLRDKCKDLNKRGVNFLLSNSDTKFIRELYSDFKIIQVKATRNINSKGGKRGRVSEVLIKNY